MRSLSTCPRGFTLIELLIVVAVIGVLAAIAVPAFSQYRVRGYNSNAVADITSVRHQLELYYMEHQEYP